MNLQQRPTNVGAERVAQSERNGPALVPSLSTSAHRDPANTVLAALATDNVRGLRHSDALRRLEQYGHNRLKSAPETY